jgi:hypothetical protein
MTAARAQENTSYHAYTLHIPTASPRPPPQVFTCEQQLYNKADLDRHMKVGDSSGPLADSGFKGHPLCRFCKRRFYDNNELFKHMESAHEQCFLCRRHQPEKYVYYRDYAELEGEWRWGWGWRR